MSLLKNTSDFSQVEIHTETTEANKPQAGYNSTLENSGYANGYAPDATAQSEQANNDNELNETTPFYSETKEAEPYPIDAFPSSLNGVIEYCKADVECDVAMIAPSLLCSLSIAFQHHYVVKFKLGHKYFDDMKLSLAVIILAHSSERKSSLEDKIFKPFKNYEMNSINEATQSIDDARKKLNDFNDKDKALKGVITAIEKKLLQETDETKEEKLRASLKKSQENYDIFQKNTQQPTIPPTRRLIVKDVTLESLQRYYVSNTPFLAMINSEGGIFFNGYSMNKDNSYASLAKLCDLVDGEPIDVMRVTSGDIKLFNKALAVWLSVQPEVGKDFIRNGRATSQGFLPRCLLSQATEKAGYRLMQTPYTKVNELRENFYKPYLNRIKEVMNTPYKAKPDNALELDRPHITLMNDAEKRLSEFYKHVETEQQKGKAYYYHKSFAGKAMQRVVQIATLFTLYEGKSFVEKSYIEQAITIVTWHLKEAMRIIDGESDAGLPPYDTEKGLAENLRRYLFEKVFINGNQSFNLRDLQNKLTRNKIGKTIRDLQITHGKDVITGISEKYRYLIEMYLVENDWLLRSNNGISYEVNHKAL